MSHFNDQAALWDSEDKIAMMRLVAEKTLDQLKLTHPIDIMDFGCGTGLFGLEFSDFAKTLVGVDTSSGMLEVFRKKTQGQKQFKALICDLEAEEYGEKFDLIISSMAFHHLNFPGKMILKFREMLREGGRIAIVDLDKEGGTFHPDPKEMGVKHFGFSLNEIESWANDAGMKIHYHLINEIEKNEKTYKQFLAIFSF